MIHPAAIVSPRARLGEGVAVGPHAVIGDGVEIGDRTSVGAHAVIEGPTRIGADNRIYAFGAIGGDPQDKKYDGSPTRLEIGDRNVIREYCTLHRGTRGGGGVTRIGDDNWIMAYVHVAHDCRVGSGTVMANCATLAGHAAVDDFASLGALTVVHQFCAIGRHAFTAMGTVLFKDLPPYVTAGGNPAAVHGLNREGLRRAGAEAETIRQLQRAYRTVYREGLRAAEAVARLEALPARCPEVGVFAGFIAASRRGIVRRGRR